MRKKRLGLIDLIRAKIPSFMNDGEYGDVGFDDLVHNPIGIQGEFSNMFLIELGYFFTRLGQLIQDIAFLSNILGNFFSVMERVVSDEVMDGS